MRIDFRYEDGPQDCEALAVDSIREKIYLASKSLLPACKVYQLPLPTRQPPEKLVGRWIATVPISLATGMDISPNARCAVICNYGQAFTFGRRRSQPWADAFAQPPRTIPLPNRQQGESVCFDRHGRNLYLTSEKLPTPLIEVPAESLGT